MLKTVRRFAFLAIAVFAVTAGTAEAHGQPAGFTAAANMGFHHHPGHWRYGAWTGIGIGIGFGTAFAPAYYDVGPAWYPDYVVAEPLPPPRFRRTFIRREPAVPSAPDPVFSPTGGQDATQTESDRRSCNLAAMTQADAMTDAAVFQRTTLACMEGRGYSIR